MKVRFHKTVRRFFGIASIVAFVLLVASIASLWGNFEIHWGSWEFALDHGMFFPYQPPPPGNWMGEVLVPSVGCSDAAIVFGYLLLFLLLGYAFARRFYEVKVREAGGCQNCGYNLTGNTSGVCPECGTAVGTKARA